MCKAADRGMVMDNVRLLEKRGGKSGGKRYEAVYAMQQQPDGSWKIAGVQMVEIPGVDA